MSNDTCTPANSIKPERIFRNVVGLDPARVFFRRSVAPRRRDGACDVPAVYHY